MSPRPYNLGIRKAVAEESRRRVLDAAKQLLASGSAYEHFTVDTVAAHADVSRQTVYHQFHSKRGLLESMLDVMAQDAGLIEGIIKFRSQTDCLGALSVFTDTFCRFWGENRETISKLTAVAALHPELALALKERRKRRSENVEVLANMVAAE
ncbi:MAG TPA: TetR/AcrR family transcriptional regulator, partial [Acidimicrobiales bacterium]|nr:TetR/AcrR family transcriptional regulator [Acidimicrobiales bacterium]